MPSKQPPFLLLGQILRPHGIRGELRVNVLTAYPERIGPDMVVYLGSDPDSPATSTGYKVVQARTHQQYLILQLEGITDRDAADRLREQYVMVELDHAVPLAEDEFYLYQAIGLSVFTDEGEALGRVVEILETGANDVYVVQGPRGEILLPSIEDCILDVDIEAGKMTVHLLDGLLGD
jgi:16S rRNA processing protein RimM